MVGYSHGGGNERSAPCYGRESEIAEYKTLVSLRYFETLQSLTESLLSNNNKMVCVRSKQIEGIKAEKTGSNTK